MYSRLRRCVQVLVILGLLMIPLLSVYERLISILSNSYYGNLASESYIIKNQLPDFLIGSVFWPIILWFDKLFPSIIPNANEAMAIIDGLKGAPWNITLGWLTISDPLAVSSVVLSTKEINLHLISTTIIPILIALLLGRFFCGWLCPIRTILEMATFLRRKIVNIGVKLPSIQLPTYISYHILLLGFVAAIGGVLIFPFLLPYAIMSRTVFLWVFGLTLSPAVLFIILLVIFEISIIPSQWCNSLCPTGTVLGLFGRTRLLKIKANKGSCLSDVGCNQCAKACFMNIHPVLEVQGRMKSQCTSCGACIDACKTRSLGFSLKNQSLEIKNPKLQLNIFKKLLQ